jgi:hypothetical protein
MRMRPFHASAVLPTSTSRTFRNRNYIGEDVPAFREHFSGFGVILPWEMTDAARDEGRIAVEEERAP